MMKRMSNGKRAVRWALPAFAVAAAACAGGASHVPAPLAPQLGIDVSQMTHRSNGLYVQDLQEGQGEAARFGDTVVLHYTGWLSNGLKFDDSRERGEPIEFVLGSHEVIRGWEDAIVGMKVGGQRRIVVPPALGYGRQAQGEIIPPNTTLVFELELLDVR